MNELLFPIALLLSYLSSLFAGKQASLFTARFARLHEFLRLLVRRKDALKSMPVILIGLASFNRLFAVRPTSTQKELANAILLGKTRVGKGLAISTNLLTWPFSGYCQRHKAGVLGANLRMATKGLKRPLPDI